MPVQWTSIKDRPRRLLTQDELLLLVTVKGRVFRRALLPMELDELYDPGLAVLEEGQWVVLTARGKLAAREAAKKVTQYYCTHPECDGYTYGTFIHRAPMKGDWMDGDGYVRCEKHMNDGLSQVEGKVEEYDAESE